MTTKQIIEHSEKLQQIVELIISEAHQIEQLKNSRAERNWLFHSHDEIVSTRKKYSHTLEIKELALERLKTRYINELSKLN